MYSINSVKFLSDYAAKQDELKKVKEEAESYVNVIPNLSEETKAKITETLINEFGSKIKVELKFFENYAIETEEPDINSECENVIAETEVLTGG
jgi:predicted CopG family antitoxin